MERKASYALRDHETLRVHGLLREARHQAAQLQQRADALEHAHVRPADLADVLELDGLRQLVHGLHHTEHRRDNVQCRVAERPHLVELVERRIDLAPVARRQQLVQQHRVRLVAHLEHVVRTHEPLARPCRLQVVDRLPHVPLGGEHDRREALVGVLDVLRLADLHQPAQQLLVRDAPKPQDRTATLNRFNDLVGLVAREAEARRVGINLHRTA